MKTLRQVSIAFLLATLFVSCGSGEVDHEVESDFAGQRAKMTRQMVERMIGRAAYWKEQQGGAGGDFSGIRWKDLHPKVYEAMGDFEQAGDTYVRRGWYEATITSRQPLTLDVRMPKAGRRMMFTLPGTDPEAVIIRDIKL